MTVLHEKKGTYLWKLIGSVSYNFFSFLGKLLSSSTGNNALTTQH